MKSRNFMRRRPEPQRDIGELLASTRTGVGEIMGWLVVVTLDQEWDFSRERLDKVFRALIPLTDEVGALIERKGRVEAERELAARLRGSLRQGESVKTAFTIPMLRAPRGETERQLRRAGDEAATMTWLIYALAVHEGVGFGAKRLNDLHEKLRENYLDMNRRNAQDKEQALRSLQVAAEYAIGEAVGADLGEMEAEKKRNPVMDALKQTEWALERLNNVRIQRQSGTLPLTISPAELTAVPLVREGLPWRR